MSTEALSCADLGVKLGDRWILRHLDLSFSVGRTYAVTGPSGAGKTTLLSTLGGLVTPDEGTVHIPLDVPDALGLRPAISWLTQRANLIGRRTVTDNVALSSLAAGCSRNEANERASDALHDLGLDALAGREARSLSGGEAARVALARSIAVRPAFLLADEPTGNLDAAATDQMVALLTKPDPHRCVIVVTHDQRVAERCDERLELTAQMASRG